MESSKFFICGFAGAGKSTLLSQLEKLNIKKIDLDDLIFETYRDPKDGSLAELIERIGEQKFRGFELEVLKSLEGPIVVALGGGTLNQKTAQLLESYTGMWLDTPFELCWERIRGDENRPITLGKSKDELKQLYDDRKIFYQKYQPVKDHTQVLDIIINDT